MKWLFKTPAIGEVFDLFQVFGEADAILFISPGIGDLEIVIGDGGEATEQGIEVAAFLYDDVDYFAFNLQVTLGRKMKKRPART